MLISGLVNPLNNEHISMDFKPLLQCIHIYDALNSRAELQQAYQADRQVSPACLAYGATPNASLPFSDKPNSSCPHAAPLRRKTSARLCLASWRT